MGGERGRPGFYSVTAIAILEVIAEIVATRLLDLLVPAVAAAIARPMFTSPIVAVAFVWSIISLSSLVTVARVTRTARLTVLVLGVPVAAFSGRQSTTAGAIGTAVSWRGRSLGALPCHIQLDLCGFEVVDNRFHLWRVVGHGFNGEPGYSDVR